MVHELAEFEKAPEQCHLTAEQLHTALFDPAPALFGHVATGPDGHLLGYALWFRNFSTWEGVHGVYLEDIYVRPEARGTGAGRLLIATLARICVERGYQRLDLQVLDWNPARDVYTRLGFTHQAEWLPYRLSGAPLHALASS
ncbi:GNAT family N-acetyltransferase [Actinomycetes bacterium KLBMP 9797]